MNGMTFARICGHKLTIRRALYTASTIKTSYRTIKTNLSFPQINSNKKYLFKRLDIKTLQGCNRYTSVSKKAS
jgi:5-bromo-4-chloroindolyl phosphate hydrolysis protein